MYFMTAKRCSKLLHLIRKAAMPPLFVLVGRVDRLLAFQLRGRVDSMTILVVFEAKTLFFVSFTLYSKKSSSDGVEVNFASVCRRSSSASAIATAASSTGAFTTLKSLRTC
jgi:hypothetical protein